MIHHYFLNKLGHKSQFDHIFSMLSQDKILVKQTCGTQKAFMTMFFFNSDLSVDGQIHFAAVLMRDKCVLFFVV
jgi:hypothetical protein